MFNFVSTNSCEMQTRGVREYSIIRAVRKQCTKGVRRIIRRKGHGVHSPYVYNFIIRVIEEKAQYYAYPQIEEQYSRVKNDKQTRPMPLKYSKLLYRIANRIKPQQILECGTDYGISTIAMQLAGSSAKITTIEQNKNIATYLKGAIEKPYAQALQEYYSNGSRPELIYISKQDSADDYKTIYKHLTANMNESSVIVISGIRKTKQTYTQFTKFASNNIIKVTIDLYDVAILVASPKLNKQTFKVWF